MSMSARERQALNSIADELAESAPDLVAKLTAFARTVGGEEMPPTERSRAGRRRLLGALSRWLRGWTGHRRTGDNNCWTALL